MKQANSVSHGTKADTDWAIFCDDLKAAGQVILRSETPATSLDRAEGWRYLSRLTRMGLEMMLEFADPEFPVFYAASHDTVKIFAPNPDNTYLNATIAGNLEYRIFGERGTVPYLSFGTKANRFAVDGTMPSTGELDAADIEIQDDGRFEIFMSQRPRRGNWLPLAEDSSMLLVRQTFLDRNTETAATVHIECTNGAERPTPLDSNALGKALKSAAAFVGGTATMLADLSQAFSREPNMLQSEPWRELSMRTGGDPSICYFHGFWRLAPHQALVIDTEVPECVYWNFQLNNYWMESLDYRFLPIAVNGHSARYNTDGTITIVVAARDTGLGNFIDTAGHTSGTMLLRWVSADRHPTPKCRVVELSALEAESNKPAWL